MEQGVSDAVPEGILRDLSQRQPKPYPCVWVVAQDRPLLYRYDDGEPWYVVLFTCRQLAEESRLDTSVDLGVPLDDLPVRRLTLVKALEVLRSLPRPVVLLAGQGEAEPLGGVAVEGKRTLSRYAL